MTHLRIAACRSLALDAQAPEWAHLLPLGDFSGEDGRGPYALRDAEALIADFAERGKDLLVDFDHASLRTQGPDSRAAGWVCALEARDDGLWGRIEWTQAGRDAIAKGEFRHLSPVFAHSEDGVIVRIHGVALVNTPNLDLAALDADEAASDEADAATPDPRDKEIARLTGELHALRTEHAQARARREVDALISQGRLAPAQRGWAMGYALRDPQGYAAFARAQPRILPADPPMLEPDIASIADAQTPAARAIARQFGIDLAFAPATETTR